MLKKNKGYLMIEILILLIIFASLGVTLYQLSMKSNSAANNTNTRAIAMQIANEAFDKMKANQSGVLSGLYLTYSGGSATGTIADSSCKAVSYNVTHAESACSFTNMAKDDLMELLVTVAVVGVLAAVAIPSYKSYSVKTRRSEGRAFVMEIMQRQEKYYTENNTYTTNLTQLGYSSATPNSERSYYTVTATAASDGIANNVVLTAAPAGSQTADTECGSFIMSSTGAKSTSTSSTTCWNK